MLDIAIAARASVMSRRARGLARLGAIGLIWALTSGTGATQPGPWLPPEAEAGMVTQLAGRLAEAGWGDTDDRRHIRAREVVAVLRARIEGWGPAAIISRAPAFAEVKMPPTKSAPLDAMARYQTCGLVLMLQHLQPPNPAAVENRASVALGLTAGTMAMLRLREPFLADGGTDAAMRAYLRDNTAFEAEFDRIQSSTALVKSTLAACVPAINALIQ